MKLIKDNQAVVITGDTGCGKSTQLSQMLYEAGYAKNGPIVITQPRRIGAVSLAQRVAQEMDVDVGQEVGYQIRFEDVTSSRTKIKYVTDGCLLRECLVHTELQPYSVIVLDEAHERSLQTDILFGVIRRMLAVRKDLKLIVTSATLDTDKFCKYYFNCPSFHIPGRCFPVEVTHTFKTEKFYVEAAIAKVLEIHTKEKLGHILVFLTGQKQIQHACKLLAKRVDKLYEDGIDMPDIAILPVYAALPAHEQQKVFAPAPPDCRKVLISTNICETSLTVDGVVYVVDPGYVKQRQFNPQTGIDALTVVPISRTAAVQRAGRAGRTEAGKCYRLYTKKVFDEVLLAESVPEIQRTNLANTILLLKSMGINNPLSFHFLDKPRDEAIVEALLQLFYLSAISTDGKITSLGKSMSQFPLEPSLSKLLMTANQIGCADEMLSITAMISAENLWIRPADKEDLEEAEEKRLKFASKFGDHISLLFVYDSWLEAGCSKGWCAENYMHDRVLKKAKDVRTQLEEILKNHKKLQRLDGHQMERAVASAKRHTKRIARRNRRHKGRRSSSTSKEKGKRKGQDSRSRSASSSRSAKRSRGARSRSRGKSKDRDRDRDSRRSNHRRRRTERSTSRGRDKDRDSRKNRSADPEQRTKREEEEALEKDSKLDPVTKCRKVIAQAFFPNTCRRTTLTPRGEGIYKAYQDGAATHERSGSGMLHIHPMSTLRTVAPKWVVYNELVFTTKPFIKGLCTIEYDWVMELLPRLRSANIRKLVGEEVTLLEPTAAEGEPGAEPNVVKVEEDQGESQEAVSKTPAPSKEALEKQAAAKDSKAKSARARFLARKMAASTAFEDSSDSDD